MTGTEVAAVVGHRCGRWVDGADGDTIRAGDLGAASAHHSHNRHTFQQASGPGSAALCRQHCNIEMAANATVSASVAGKSSDRVTRSNSTYRSGVISLMQQEASKCLPRCDVPF